MPDRTSKELEQIKDDFIAIKKLVDQKLERQSSRGRDFRGLDMYEKVELFNNREIALWKELYDNCNIESCEALAFIENAIGFVEGRTFGLPQEESMKNLRRNIPSMMTHNLKVVPSHDWHVVGDLTLDQIVNLLETDPTNKRLNRNLDKIAIGKCIPIACEHFENIDVQQNKLIKNSSLPKINGNNPVREV